MIKSNFFRSSLFQFSIFGIPFLLLICILLIISWSFFSYRWVWQTHFDPIYFTDWYEHSQWQIPLSPRVMGDAELYQISGYRLATGGNPFQINPEVPPLVKYFYGLSIIWTGSPYYVSAFFYILSLVSFGWLARLLLPNQKWASGVAVILFLLNPIFFSQIAQVGLDMPQLCFLLLHVLFFFIALQEQKDRQIISFFLSGIFLGTFAATKIGFFFPMILLIDTWVLWKVKKIWWLFLLIILSAVTYIAAYTPYFFQHHSFIEWLKAQKWIIEFYFSSHFGYLPGMIFTSLLIGTFVHWTNGIVRIKEWTIVWPISLGVLFWIGFQQLHKYKKFFLQQETQVADLFWPYILLLAVGLIVMNTVIPFWPRYLIIILPFLLFFATQFLSQHHKLLMSVLVILGIQFIWYSFSQPEEMVGISTAAWQNYSYAEVYNFTTEQTQQSISRLNFVEKLQQVQIKLEDPQLDINTQIPITWPWQNTVFVPATVTYHTLLGDMPVSTYLHLVRQHNQWRIAWNWQNVLPNFDSYSQVVMTKEIPKGGELRSSDNIILSQGGSWPFISVIPDKVKNREKLIATLTSLTPAQGAELRVSMFVTHPGDLPIPVGFVQPFAQPEELTNLGLYQSVRIDERWARVYNPGIRQLTSLKFVRDREQEHSKLFGQLGGQIIINQPNGKKITIWEKVMQDGQNVILQYSFEELLESKHD